MSGLPRNGDALLRMRREGMRPEGMTLISLIGDLPYTNFMLYADPASAIDWTPVAGLDVDLIVDTSISFATVLRQLANIAAATPEYLILSYREGPRIECGRARYVLETFNPNTGRMLFDWFPVAVGAARHDVSRKIEQRLWSELGDRLPAPFDAALARISKNMEREVTTWRK
jgi:hypothetical protein